jgi:hypothetical protein
MFVWPSPGFSRSYVEYVRIWYLCNNQGPWHPITRVMNACRGKRRTTSFVIILLSRENIGEFVAGNFFTARRTPATLEAVICMSLLVSFPALISGVDSSIFSAVGCFNSIE